MKGLDTTIAVVIALITGILVVVVVSALVQSNAGELENLVLNNIQR